MKSNDLTFHPYCQSVAHHYLALKDEYGNSNETELSSQNEEKQKAQQLLGYKRAQEALEGSLPISVADHPTRAELPSFP